MADLAKSIRFRKVFFDVAGLQFTDWGLQQERLEDISLVENGQSGVDKLSRQ